MITSFYFGFKLGSKQEIKPVDKTPIAKKVMTKLRKEEHNKEEEALWKVINNIENYNGSSEGQEAIN